MHIHTPHTPICDIYQDMGPRDVPYLRKEDDTAKPHSVGDTSGLELHQASYRLGETEKVEQWMEETQAAEGMSGVSLIGAIDQGTGSSRLQVQLHVPS